MEIAKAASGIVARAMPLPIRIAAGARTVRLIARPRGGKTLALSVQRDLLFQQAARLCVLLETTSCTDRELCASIRDLGRTLLDPLKSALAKTSELVVTIRGDLLSIPIDLLNYRRSPLFAQKQIAFRIARTSVQGARFSSNRSAYMLSDITADPQRGCLKVAGRFGQVTFQDARDASPNSVRRMTPKDVVVMSLHGQVGLGGTDHMQVDGGKLRPGDLLGLRPKLIYLDSCRLGLSWAFLERLRRIGTMYCVAPIISNEAGDSSTRTMETFFKHLLDGVSPEQALFLSKRELWDEYSGYDLRQRL
jgi:hypothetical protein